MDNETYLGDAVYASFDGYQIWLRTTDGIRTLDRIALEPSVYDALVRFRYSIYKKQVEEKPE